jgi:hypothetical protein
MTVLQSLDMITCYSPLFVFVGPTEACSLENFGNLWRANAADFQTFEKK